MTAWDDMDEDGDAWIKNVQPIIAQAEIMSGLLPCPRCLSDASWSRNGRNWQMVCEVCDWNAAGCLAAVRN